MSQGPDISFIISAYDRPDHLRVCLASLRVQTNASIEVIVTDNAEDHLHRSLNEAACEYVNETYVYAAAEGCYHSAEMGAELATGEYLCFPSDDSYYVPSFSETMLKAARERDLDLVYCEMLYNPRWPGDTYRLLGVEPRLNKIDKTGFIIRRDKFPGFPDKHPGYCAADGMLIERLVQSGVRHGKVADALAVHN